MCIVVVGKKPNGLNCQFNKNSIPPIEEQNQWLNINGFIASTDSSLEEINPFDHLVSTISIIKFRLNSIKHVYSELERTNNFHSL